MRYSMKALVLIKGLANKALPLLFWISLIFGFDLPYISILTVLSAVVHEIGHITPLIYFGGLSLPVPTLKGFLISSNHSQSYNERIICALGGPVSNIILFLILFIFTEGKSSYLSTFAWISLATGLSNLLPLEGYDGYNILNELFLLYECHGAQLWLWRISFLLLSSLTLLSLCLIDRLGSGYWFFALFFLSCLEKIKNRLSSNHF